MGAGGAEKPHGMRPFSIEEATMPALDKIDGQLVYQPDGATLAEYITDRHEVGVIVGPIGSGSSTASCFKIWFTACEQHVSEHDGKRHTKWAIVRTTYPELNTSTLPTWLTWFPEETYGKLIRSRPMNQVIQIGDIDLEIWFLALDDADDIKKLRSTEFTGIWFNELEYHSYEMFSEAHSRVAQGRFPPMMHGGPKWHGILADMNAPDEDHFVSRMAGWSEWPDDVPEESRLKWPKEWWLKKQPQVTSKLKTAARIAAGAVVSRGIKLGLISDQRRPHTPGCNRSMACTVGRQRAA